MFFFIPYIFAYSIPQFITNLNVFSFRFSQAYNTKQKVLDLINKGDKPKNTSFKKIKFDEIELVCEVSSESNKPRPYVPLEAREEAIKSLHFDHLGIDPTTKRIANQYYWPTLKADVKLHVKTCDTCKKVKPNKKLAETGKFTVPDKRMTHVI